MPITAFDEYAFYGPIDLRYLRMTHCQILQMPPLNPVKRTLRSIVLANNKITTIPMLYFYGFGRLNYLDLSHNSLTSISQLYALSATLETLFLDTNRLKNFPATFNNTVYTVLSELSMQDNELTKCRKDVLHLFPSLKKLNIMANSISHVEDLRSLRRLVRLMVSAF